MMTLSFKISRHL